MSPSTLHVGACLSTTCPQNHDVRATDERSASVCADHKILRTPLTNVVAFVYDFNSKVMRLVVASTETTTPTSERSFSLTHKDPLPRRHTLGPSTQRRR